MIGTLFYQPSRRWRIVAAFAGALLIHFGAIVVAGIQQREGVSGPGFAEDKFVIINVEPQPPEKESTPPNISDTAPAPEPSNDALIADEFPTPTPVRRPNHKLTLPIQKLQGPQARGLQSPLYGKVFAISAPRPEYPYEARRQKLMGHGIALLTVDPASGGTVLVTMLKSTGSVALDNAALDGFRRWRFKPGSPPKVQVPITFTMTGAQY